METSHVGKRAYKVKGLTERGAAQMTFWNKYCPRLRRMSFVLITGQKSGHTRMSCSLKWSDSVKES